MAVPRHKMSRMKQRSRRGQQSIDAAARSLCPRCDDEKTPHRVCSKCGYYRGDEIIGPKAAKSSK